MKGALPHFCEKWRASGGEHTLLCKSAMSVQISLKNRLQTLSKSKELMSQLKLQLGSQCLKPKLCFPERLSANGVKQAHVRHGCCCGFQSLGSGAADVGQSWLPLLCTECVPTVCSLILLLCCSRAPIVLC